MSETIIPGVEEAVVGHIVRGSLVYYGGLDGEGEPANPINLSGYGARLQVRRSRESAEDAIVDIDDSTGITLGGVAGTIAYEYTPPSGSEGSAWWFLQLTEPGTGLVELARRRVEILPAAVRDDPA